MKEAENDRGGNELLTLYLGHETNDDCVESRRKENLMWRMDKMSLRMPFPTWAATGKDTLCTNKMLRKYFLCLRSLWSSATHIDRSGRIEQTTESVECHSQVVTPNKIGEM